MREGTYCTRIKSIYRVAVKATKKEDARRLRYGAGEGILDQK